MISFYDIYFQFLKKKKHLRKSKINQFSTSMSGLKFLTEKTLIIMLYKINDVLLSWLRI